jgi:hypothetical protein
MRKKTILGPEIAAFQRIYKNKFNKIKDVIIRLSAILAEIRSKRPIWGVFQQPRLLAVVSTLAI